MKVLSSKRRWIAALLLLLLVLFLLRPGVSRLKSRIISSISAGVGRPVDIGSVHVRLLPRPGFEIENLVIYDDPLFGDEPMLRAGEVTADLRIISLLKGRLEVARLGLNEPSFNLVHRADGAWNLQALLERAAHNSLAPTGAGKSVPRPHFPYIEGSSGRINFKSGSEKRPYALISADFSLWQESEDTWGVRLKAQPFRSDINLTDVGQLQLAGTWKRAQSFQTTPVELSLEWSKAQLGQLTKLLTGMDKGWRGNIQVDATLTGMPTDLKITSMASVDDFRRYDITSGKAVQLSARCDGEYSSLNHQFHEVMCTAPVGEGMLTLSGDMGLPGSRQYSIRLKSENVPAKAAFALMERAKKNIPEDLVADGILKGNAEIAEDAARSAPLRFHGSGEIRELLLSSAATKTEFGPVTVPFLLVDDTVKSREHLQKNRAGLVFPKGPYAEIGPVGLGTGRSVGGTLLGWLNRTNYAFSLSGDADIARTLRIARLAGIPTPAANPEGTAQLNLQIARSWMGLGGELGIGFPAPEITGTARLRNLRVPIAGASESLEVTTAEMQLSPDKVVVRKMSANAAGTVWTGTLEMPRGCGTRDACPIRFALNTEEFDFSRMSEWVNGRQKSRPWYRVLETTKSLGQSFLGKLHASGELNVNRFLLHGIEASNLSAKVRLDSGQLEFSSLNADLLGGKHRGKWEIEFSGASAACSGSGDITAVALGKMADAAHNNWVTGTASGRYEIRGPCSGDLWQSGEGKFQAEMRNGVLPRVLIGDDPEPLAFIKLTGEAQLSSGKFELSSAKLTSREGAYDLTGTVTLNREIDVKMTRQPADATHSGYAVTGTLADPRVSPLGRTEQAKLKTAAAK